MLRLLKFILLLIIVVGASVGATMWFTNRNDAASIPVADPADTGSAQTPLVTPVVPAPIFAELDPFTVTLYGEARNRILYTAITLRLGDDSSRKQITEYMPEVRDRVLKVLSAQQLPLIQTPEGRQALVDALQASLTQPFAEQLPAPRISDVLFTAFVVQ